MKPACLLRSPDEVEIEPHGPKEVGRLKNKSQSANKDEAGEKDVGRCWLKRREKVAAGENLALTSRHWNCN